MIDKKPETVITPIDKDRDVSKKPFIANLISEYTRPNGVPVQVIGLGNQVVVKEADPSGGLRFFDMTKRLKTYEETPLKADLDKYLLEIGCFMVNNTD